MHLPEQLCQYLVDLDISPTCIQIQSRSGGHEVVDVCYFRHPISGDEFKTLAAVVRGEFTTCALTLDTVVLIPIRDLGTKINLIDAIDAASLHLEGRPNRRVKDSFTMDLSKVSKRVQAEVVEDKPVRQKKTPAKQPAKKAVKRKVAPSKKIAKT